VGGGGEEEAEGGEVPTHTDNLALNAILFEPENGIDGLVCCLNFEVLKFVLDFQGSQGFRFIYRFSVQNEIHRKGHTNLET
jgi:hypothetical protein